MTKRTYEKSGIRSPPNAISKVNSRCIKASKIKSWPLKLPEEALTVHLFNLGIRPDNSNRYQKALVIDTSDYFDRIKLKPCVGVTVHVKPRVVSAH